MTASSATIDSRRSQIPAPRTPVIGRERELGLAMSLLRRPDVRLLTLTGPGGIGKTRLALEIASQLSPEFADSVRFVPLAAVLDPGLVTNAVARAMHLLDAGDEFVQSTLSAALRLAETLLILDNFEHVVSAAPLVSDLLAACPRLTILVTSRQLLRIDGEHALPIPPLAVPDRDEAISNDSVRQFAAVQLFAQRGEAIAPSFAVTDDNARLTADICLRLDGVPLAIELAAARVNHLSLQMLWDRLEGRLPLLTGGGRDRPLRLQTMRDAIAWSHQLLSADEQALFRRLAVFCGGCTLQAAEFVGGEPRAIESMAPVDPPAHLSALRPGGPSRPASPSVLDLIAALVDASLLQAESDEHGATRYRMLETIRDFAEDRLAASGEVDRIRQRHAAYFVTFAEHYGLAELLPGANRILTLMEADPANLRAMLAWLSERDDAANLLHAAASLGHFWIEQGHYHEGRTWLECALASGDGPAGSRAKALVALGKIEAYQGANLEAMAHLAGGLARCREQGDALHEARALNGLGALAIAQGDLVRGAALLEESLTAAHAVTDKRLSGIMAGWALLNLAVISRTDGDYARATGQLEAAQRLVREAGYATAMILVLGDLGDLARDQGKHERALAFYREALALGQHNPRTRVVCDVIEAVGIVAVFTGEVERGTRLLGAAEALRERIGLRFRVQENQAALAQAIATSQTALGEQRVGAAWSIGRTMTPSQAVAAALDRFGSPAGNPGISLTSRESEILRLLAAGLTDPEIATALFIGVRTVENHVGRILGTLGVRTRTAAAAAAIASGLIEPIQPATT